MFSFNSKTGRIVAAFTAVATTVMFTGCSDTSDDWNDDGGYEDQMLKDDNGNEYRLHQNQDGTETARYADGKEVTFRRDSDGNMNYVAGAAGLLGGLAAGYYLFHGYNPPSGSWNSSTNRYETKSPLKRVDDDEREKKMGKYAPAAGVVSNPHTSSSSGGSGNGGSGKSTAKSSGSSSSTKSSSSSSSSSVKSGFGSAGARSAAS